MSDVFIETYTGRKFHPFNPQKEDISIIDIAHGLSNICRYGGHSKFFYSVGQHSCLLAYYVESILKEEPIKCLQMLMHDAAEAYIGDTQSPIKTMITEFRVLDSLIMKTIEQWLDLYNRIPYAREKELDSCIVKDERAQVMNDSDNIWLPIEKFEPLGITIVPWSPKDTERRFLDMYAKYTYKVFGKIQYIGSGYGSYILGIMSPLVSSDIPGRLIDVMEVDFRGRVGRLITSRGDEWVHGDWNYVI
jgi:5'-deoxynucleotidase YfbR-like HD superfamily hydrolase